MNFIFIDDKIMMVLAEISVGGRPRMGAPPTHGFHSGLAPQGGNHGGAIVSTPGVVPPVPGLNLGSLRSN